MTERLSTEDFAKRGRDEDQVPQYREPVADYEQEPTGYDQVPSGYDTSQRDRDERDPDGYDRGAGHRAAVPEQDRQEQFGQDRPVGGDAVGAGHVPEHGVPAPGQQVPEQPAPGQQVSGQQVPGRQPADAGSDDSPLFGGEDADRFRNEWRALQTDFVDDPRGAVRRADELVAQVVQSLATTFADHKRSLEGQWRQGEQVDTEELRMALRRYRAFFDRLLSV